MKIKMLLAAGLAAGAAWAAAPKYVFLFIGDGMSTPQRMVSEEFARGAGYGPLAMNALDYQCSTRTRSADQLITDSAAAATAIACGEKTNNGMLGVTPDGTRLESVAEVAKKTGKKVGIVTTVTIVHATPAGFYGHRRSRGMYYALGLDLIDSGFDYFAGGGTYESYDEKKNPLYKGCLYDLARAAGYAIVSNRQELAALKKGGKAWGVFAKEALEFAIDGNREQPTLREMVEKGIELLDGPQGFFIMAEGGKVDYGAHANDAATTLRDVMALDEAVKVALAFARKHPRETLVVVTGDHETGGLSMGLAGTGDHFELSVLAKQTCSTEEFSKRIIAQLKADVDFPFERAQAQAVAAYGLEKLTAKETARLRKAFETDRKYMREHLQETRAHDVKRRYQFGAEAKRILAERAGLGWSSGSHTALPTLTTASGAGAEKFTGFRENSDVARILKECLAGR